MKRALVLACLLLALAPASAHAASRSAGPTTVAYGPDPYQTLQVYGSQKPDSPVVVLVHGGGYSSSLTIKGSVVKVAEELASHNIVTVDVNYDTDGPDQPAFPTEVDDVVSATRWAIANAAAYSGDPSNIVLMGGSAGSNLVALAAESGDLPPVRVVTMSGDFDLTQVQPMSPTDATALGCDPSSCPTDLEAQWSAALHVAPCPSTSWLLFNGDTERTPLTQAQEALANLQAQGCVSALIVHPGTDHSFSYFDDEETAVLAFVKTGAL